MELTKNSTEMRELMNEMKKLTESYVFQSHNQRGIGELPEESDENENLSDVETDFDMNDDNIELGESEDTYKIKIGEIRKLSLSVMQELDPSMDAEKYKTIKTILDSCDKVLTNKISTENKITEK